MVREYSLALGLRPLLQMQLNIRVCCKWLVSGIGGEGG